MSVAKMTNYAETYRSFSWDLPERFNFGADVIDRYAEDRDRAALIWCNEAGAEQRFTFADIKRLSSRLAQSLAERGIARGDRVIVMLPRLPQWQIAMIACLKLGAVAVPCIDMLTSHDLEYRITHSGARAVITTAANAEKIPAGLADLEIHLDAAGRWISGGVEIASADVSFTPKRFALEDPAVIYYTSGTTGSPKGVTHSVRALYVWRFHARYWLDLGDGDVMWCTADTGWSKAATSILLGPWSWGVPVLFYDGPFDAEKRLELLARYNVSVFCAAATELRQLVYQDVSKFDLSSLRRTVSAGEALNPEVAERWSELTGAPAHEGYGQTETLMSVHNYPCTKSKPGSMGLPLPGYTVAILGDDGAELPLGDTGTLAIALPNPNLFLGYWKEPERQAQSVVRNGRGEWWMTGDSAWMDEDGYVFFEGRADDIISSSGYRIGPSEVENVLVEHPAVRECAAVASPDPERGEIVKAFVILAGGATPTDQLVTELQEHCKRATAPYKYPREIEFVEDLPKNVAGKLLRSVLKAQEYERKSDQGVKI